MTPGLTEPFEADSTSTNDGVNYRVSVVVPAYNASAYLARCIRSIQAIEIPEMEILIVNDGSLDDSGDVARSFARTDHRIRVLDQENGGLSAARNVGVSRSRGRYIAFVDADDYVAPREFSAALRRAEQMHADVIVGGAVLVDESTRAVIERREPFAATQRVRGGMYLSSALRAGVIRMCSPYNIYLGAIVRELTPPFLPGVLHEDELWTPQALLAAESVVSAEVPFYFHSVRTAGSIMSSDNADVRSGHMLRVVQELDPVVERITDSELQSYWDDYRLSLFLSAVGARRVAGRREAWSYPSLRFLRRARTARNKWRAILYLISPKLYAAVNRAYKSSTQFRAGR